MAVSVSQVANAVVGPYRLVVNDVTMDSSYLSGGETLTPAQLGLSTHLFSVCNIKTVGGTVNVAEAFYDGALLHLWDETPAEVTSTQDVSSDVVRILSFGR